MKANFPFFRLYFIVFLFSFTGNIAKYIGLSAIPLIWMRMLIAALCLFIFLKKKKISLKIDKKTFFLMALGGFCMAANWISFFYGIKSSNVSVVLACIPVGALFTCFLEPIFFKTPFKLYQITLSLLIGACVLSISYQTVGNQIKGIVFGIIASFFSSLSAIFSNILSKKKSVELVSFYQMAAGAFFVSILFMFSLENFLEITKINVRDWFFILLLAVVFTAYGKMEAVRLIKEINPYTFQLNLNLEPIYGIVIAYFLFGESEKMNFKFYITVLIMIIGILINQKLSRTSLKKLN